MHSSISPLFLVLAGYTMASPAPQAGSPVCVQNQAYSVSQQSTPYDAEPQLVSGYRCTSNTEPCTLTESATHTVTVTKTLSGGASASLDLTKIFNLGVDAGFTYSWSTSDATGTSAGVSCPPGGITCGIRVIASLVNITGQITTTVDGFNCPDTEPEVTDFTIVAPLQRGDGPSDALKAVMDFSACLAACDATTCPTVPSSLPVCP